MTDEQKYRKMINERMNCHLRAEGSDEERDFDFDNMSKLELLETLVAYFETCKEHVDCSDENDAMRAMWHNFGLDTCISTIWDIIGQITLKVYEYHVIYRYRGRSLKLDRRKFFTDNPGYSKISEFLTAGCDKKGLEPFNIDDELVACKYNEEQMAQTVNEFMDSDIKIRGYDIEDPRVDEDFDAEAFRKQCEEVIPRFMIFQATDDELPVTDSSEKLAILCDVLDQYEDKGRKKQEPEPVTIPMEERISRAKKRYDS